MPQDTRTDGSYADLGDLAGRRDALRQAAAMPGADPRVAERVGRRLERLVNGDYRVAGELLQVAVRIGAAAHPDDGLRAAELLRKAGDRD